MRQVTRHSVGTRGLVTPSLATGVADIPQSRRSITPFRAFSKARRATRLFVLVVLVLIASGIGHLVNHPVRAESSDMGELVESLIERSDDYVMDTELIASDLGYSPAAESGIWVNPDGDCSTPIPIGSYGFATPCRSHDLGYDALRRAAADDGDLGTWARLGLDARLYADLLEVCSDERCRATATLYFGAVTANSIRQGYRSPTEEPVLPWVILGVVVVGLSLYPSRVGVRRVATAARFRGRMPWAARMSPTRDIWRSVRRSNLSNGVSGRCRRREVERLLCR